MHFGVGCAGVVLVVLIRCCVVLLVAIVSRVLCGQNAVVLAFGFLWFRIAKGINWVGAVVAK